MDPHWLRLKQEPQRHSLNLPAYEAKAGSVTLYVRLWSGCANPIAPTTAAGNATASQTIKGSSVSGLPTPLQSVGHSGSEDQLEDAELIVSRGTMACWRMSLVKTAVIQLLVFFVFSWMPATASGQPSVQDLTKAGNQYYRSGRYADAKSMYTAALVLVDAHSLAAASLLTNLGAAYKEQHDYYNALNCFDRALQIKMQLLGSTAQSTVNTRRFLESLRKDAQQKGMSIGHRGQNYLYAGRSNDNSTQLTSISERQALSRTDGEIEYKKFTIVNMCRLSENDKDMKLHPTTYERPVYKTVYAGTDIDGRPQYRQVLDHIEDVQVLHGELQVDREVKDLCHRYEVRTMTEHALLQRLARGDVIFELDSDLLFIACDDAEVKDWHVGTEVELNRVGTSLYVKLRDEVSRKVISAELIGAH